MKGCSHCRAGEETQEAWQGAAKLASPQCLGSHVHCALGPCFAQFPNYLTLMACELVIPLKTGTKENAVYPGVNLVIVFQMFRLGLVASRFCALCRQGKFYLKKVFLTARK